MSRARGSDSAATPRRRTLTNRSPIDPDARPIVGQGGLRFVWRELDPASFCLPDQWSHTGIAVLADGNVLVFDQAAQSIVVLDQDGHPRSRTPIVASNGHGLTMASGASGERLWLADNGVTSEAPAGIVGRREAAGAVVEFDLAGAEQRRLAIPASYGPAAFRPTSIAVADSTTDGRDDVWVADGYGLSLMLRYAADGRHLGTLDGAETGTGFSCPHGVLIDRRQPTPRLLVADRGNTRICVFDLDGRYRRSFGEGSLTSPSSFAIWGDLLVVAELRARLAFFDPNDVLMGHLGEGIDPAASPGWPNRLSPNGIVRPEGLGPGQFNSPHGLAAGAGGRLLVAEWLLGGRLVELLPVPG